MFYGIERINIPLIHLEHFCGQDSKHNNEYRVLNLSELRKCKSLNKEQYEEYIKTWPWVRLP